MSRPAKITTQTVVDAHFGRTTIEGWTPDRQGPALTTYVGFQVDVRLRLGGKIGWTVTDRTPRNGVISYLPLAEGECDSWNEAMEAALLGAETALLSSIKARSERLGLPVDEEPASVPAWKKRRKRR